ncbi:MAG: restriction endonuclease subunit S [Haemophilus parainfluenzae]|nr:restriction endonuclease subunit S [Haemophilus parainfluenzae]
MKNNRTFLEKLLDGAEVKWKPLGKVTDIKTGQSVSKNIIAQNPGIYPVINSGREPLGFINEWNTENDPIGITTRGAGVGSITWQEGKYFRGNLNYSVTIKSEYELNVRFLYHILLHFQKEIHNLCSFTGIPALNASELKKLEIPIPPLPVQTEIVKILDALTALTSELTSELTLRRKQYEYYREKLLSEEELGKVGFEWKTLGDVAKIQRGASPRPISQYITDDPNGIPWIKIGDTSLDSKYIENTAQKITIEGAEKSRILKSGDFVMSNSMSYGRPYILKISGAIHDGWASISDFENILNSDFLYYYLSSNTVQSYWNGKINSSSVSNLNSDIIKSLPIPIPTLNIQIEIAKTLDKFEILTNSITEGLPLAIEQSQKRYEYYRELLLSF